MLVVARRVISIGVARRTLGSSLHSYLKITFFDETTMRLWRAKDYEGLHTHFRENCEAVLDVGYPDAEIKEGSLENMKNLRKVKKDQHGMVSALS